MAGTGVIGECMGSSSPSRACPAVQCASVPVCPGDEMRLVWLACSPFVILSSRASKTATRIAHLRVLIGRQALCRSLAPLF